MRMFCTFAAASAGSVPWDCKCCRALPISAATSFFMASGGLGTQKGGHYRPLPPRVPSRDWDWMGGGRGASGAPQSGRVGVVIGLGALLGEGAQAPFRGGLVVAAVFCALCL